MFIQSFSYQASPYFLPSGWQGNLRHCRSEEILKSTSFWPKGWDADYPYLETHLHADFVSGHMDLAAKTGAEIVAPRARKCHFSTPSCWRRDEFQVEDMSLRILNTPGHTPEHITYV